VHYQLIKVAFGALDSATIVSTSNGFPVDLRTNNLSGNLNVNLAASGVTQAVSGTITANAGTGTFTVQDSSSLVDDAAFSPASSRVLAVGFTFDDVTPDTVNEGDIGAARMSANRNIYVQLRDAAGNERGLNVDAAGAIGITDAGGTLTIDNGTLAVVGGGTEGTALRVTVASDSTGVLSIDDNGASITVDGTVTANAGTGTFTVQDTASLVDDAAFTPATSRVLMFGAEFDNVAVDSVDEGDAGALRMSANRNLLVNIRDAAGNERGLNVDAAGSIGVTHSTLSVVGGGTEATALRVTVATDSTGVLSIDDNGGSLTVDGTVTANAGTGTFTVGGTVTANAGTGTFTTSDTATQIDDAAFTPATSRVMMIGGTFDDVTPDSVNEGDGGAVRMSANRNLFTTLRDAAGNERGVNVDATNRLSVSVDNTATVTISSLPNEGQQTMANSISVAVASDQANIPVSQATASALNAQVVGTVAHDGADSGNPVKVGGVARTTNPTAVAAGDRVDLFADDLGRSVVYPIAPRDGIVVGSRISLTSTTETTLVAATASTFHDLVMLVMSNESATEVRVDFRDTTGGTVLFSIDLAGDGGGAVIPFRVPWPQATVNTNWTAQCSAGVSTVYVSALCVNNN
jgi:hypothetical protein